jgi:hypothetical protein
MCTNREREKTYDVHAQRRCRVSYHRCWHVAEDNRKNLIIELSRIVRKDSAADVVMPSSKIVSAQKKKGGKYLVVKT